VLWATPFGDFTNGAQVVIDTFISAGDDERERPGAAAPPYEGQGPRAKQRVHRAVPAALRRAHWQIVVPSRRRSTSTCSGARR